MAQWPREDVYVGGKFCPECGQPLQLKKRCGKCGAETEGAPKFCPACGQKYG